MSKVAPQSATTDPVNTDDSDILHLIAVEPLRVDGVDVAPDEPFVANSTTATALVGAGAARYQ